MNVKEELHYSPPTAIKAVVELTGAMKAQQDMEYAKALLADPRMTSNYGLMASCGLTTREVKRVKALMSDGMPTLEAQRRAIDFLNRLEATETYGG